MPSNIYTAQVTLGPLFCWGCWISGFALILAACFGPLADPFAPLGVGIMLVSATQKVTALLAAMDERERRAFDLGRESVRQLRR